MAGRKQTMKNTKRIVALLAVIVCIASLIPYTHAVNSYMKLWEHVPDAEPHVFGDRVYVYGSHDVFESRMCGPNYVVWSAPVDDLTNWKYEGISFDGGESGYLLAPDACQGPDGRYYIYAFGDCDQGGRGQTFCAVSDKPEGPFEYVGPVTIDGKAQMIFDPAVLVDDDGSVYLFGGASNIWKLDPTDMRTVIEGPFQVQEKNDKDELVQIRNFQEGSSIRKVDDWYVFVYASKHDISREWYPTTNFNNNYCNGTLEYAYSKTIYGPYTYGGVVIDNRGEKIDTGSKSGMRFSNYSGNTHGGIEQVNGQWYVFYHRQTGTDEYARQAMVAPIEVKVEEGKGGKVEISEGEYTSEGFSLEGLDPFERHSAGIACWLTATKPVIHEYPNNKFFGSYVEASYGGEPGMSKEEALASKAKYDAPYNLRYNTNRVINNTDGSIVGYKYFNFTKSYDGDYLQLLLRLIPEGIDGTITIMADRPWESQGGKVLGKIELKADMPQISTELALEIPSLADLNGKHALFFVFSSDTKDKSICILEDFIFRY